MPKSIDRILAVPRRWRGISLLCLAPLALGFAARWMVSAPLDAAGGSPSRSADGSEVETRPRPLEGAAVSWPVDRLEGAEAKRVLRRALIGLVDRLEDLSGYEAVVRRHEKVGRRWLKEQTLRMKVRHQPASVYMKDIGVEQGTEIIHVEGQRDGRLLSRPGGGMIARLLPPLELDPHSKLAMTQSRFPITEAGLLPVARRLLGDIDRDRNDPDASLVLDRVELDDGRTRLRSIQRYDSPDGRHPFARIEVHYDPETLVPLCYDFHEWPEDPGDAPPLAGRYIVESFDPGAVPGDLDFDPSNPDYGFR
jgi:hypothetical protein